MSIKLLLNKKIDDFAKDYPEFNKETVNKKFLFFVIFQILKDLQLEYDEIIDGIIDAPYDCGIDAIYVFSAGELIKEDETLDLQISKEGILKMQLIQVTRDDGFSESVLLKLKNAIEDIFNFEKEINRANEYFQKKVDLIRKSWEYCFNQGSINQIEIELVYATLSNTRVNKSVLKIEDKIKQYLNSQQLNFVKLKYIGIPELYKIISEGSYEKEIVFKDVTQYAESYNPKLTGFYGLVKLKDLLEFLSDPDGEIIEKYFEGNVRDFYGISKKVNVRIKETIENSESRINFWCLNNGITIICGKANQLGKKLKISNFHIVNGCQTAHVLHNYKEYLENDDRSEILVKVIQTDDEAVSNEIIEATNSQTAVSPISLRSNDLIQKSIEDYFLRNEIQPLFYERRINYYRRRNKPRNKTVSIMKLFQIFYSIFSKKPSVARGRPAEAFNTNYDIVFNQNYDYDSYLFAFLWYSKIYNLNRNEIKKARGKFMPLVVKYGQFHLARIAFSLAIQKDPKINFQDKNNAFTVNKEYLLSLINNENKLKIFYESSVEILKNCIKKSYGKNKDLILSYNLFKSDELDKDINKELIEKFRKQKEKLRR